MASIPSPDSIADCVLETFAALPRKFKPRQLSDGRREKGHEHILEHSSSRPHDGHNLVVDSPHLTCAALATGMKCLPRSKLNQARGNVLHDWHAEILAIRGFNSWILNECEELAKRGDGEKQHEETDWVRRRTGIGTDQHTGEGWARHPFQLKDDVRIHMYCSEAPCGDASMELTMADQEDAAPWSVVKVSGDEETEMLGRGHFDRLGIVRRKPARPDAPITLSKSCSDKIALKQVTGLLSSLSSLLVHPGNVYLSTLVLPESQCIPEAVRRAFSATGRMEPLTSSRSGTYGSFAFKPFTVSTTSREFQFSKRPAADPVPVPSNLSALYTPYKQEVLISGVLSGRSQFDRRGASSVSRSTMWKRALDLAILTASWALVSALDRTSYEEVKKDKLLEERRKAKQEAIRYSLKSWRKNDGDGDWGLKPHSEHRDGPC